MEPKYFDVASPGIIPNWSGNVGKCSAVPQGVGTSARIADEINTRALEMRMCFHSPATGTAQDYVRLMIFVWQNDDSGAAPTGAFILQTTGVLSTPLSPVMFTNARAEDYGMIHDELISVPANPGGGPIVRDFMFRLGSRIRYGAAQVTGNGNIYVALFGASAAGGAGFATVDWYSRLHYTDL